MGSTDCRKLAVLICAKAKSVRFPGKHYAEYKKKPLWKHTFNFAKRLGKETFVFTNDDLLAEKADNFGFNFIRDPGNWGPDPQMDMMQYIHEKIKADVYIMLPITSPDRELHKLLQFLTDFLNSVFAKSATSIKMIDRSNYKLSGAFWFFKKEQFYRGDVIDENTILFKMDSIDIDHPSDLLWNSGIVQGGVNNKSILGDIGGPELVIKSSKVSPEAIENLSLEISKTINKNKGLRPQNEGFYSL